MAYIMGAVAYRVSSFPKKFEFASLCSFICLQAVCINFQDLCARLLGVAALRILLLTFTSRFVIDFMFDALPVGRMACRVRR